MERPVDEDVPDRKAAKKQQDDGTRQAQKLLLTWLIEEEDIYEKIKNIISEKDFIEPLYHTVANMLFEQLREGNINPARILNQFTDEEEHRQAAELFNTSLREEMNHEEKEKALNEMVKKVKKNSLDYEGRTVTDMAQLQQIIEEQKKLQKIRISL